MFSQTGSTRWTWREIWNHLAHGGDASEAAAIIGAIAGLGKPQVSTSPCFAEVAVAFLEAAPEPGWSWRCAWPDSGDVAPWVERYRSVLLRYGRTPSGEALPTIARIWGAIRNEEAAIIVDQQNLRTWIATDDTVTELRAADPVERIVMAAETMTGQPALGDGGS